MAATEGAGPGLSDDCCLSTALLSFVRFLLPWTNTVESMYCEVERVEAHLYSQSVKLNAYICHLELFIISYVDHLFGSQITINHTILESQEVETMYLSDE